MIELLNKDEHLGCYLYNNQNTPLIAYEEIKRGEAFVYNETHSQIIFLLKGKITFSYEYQVNNIFEEGSFLMFSGRHKCTVQIEEDSTVLKINMHNRINFCSHFPLEMLCQLNENSATSIYPLKANERILSYLRSVVISLSDGLKCSYFQDLKQRELLFYLRAYYPKKDLVAFFAPILNNDIQFSKIVYENYETVKNIEELAECANYSVSGFKKRFVKVFGMSPQHWINNEKAKKLYYEINTTQKTFAEIAAEYDFSSAAHFDRFCKKMYGMSPGALRRNSEKRILFDKIGLSGQ